MGRLFSSQYLREYHGLNSRSAETPVRSADSGNGNSRDVQPLNSLFE